MNRIAICIILVVALYSLRTDAQAQRGHAWHTLVRTTQVDITGDGKPENIQLTAIRKGSAKFRLNVNGVEQIGRSSFGGYSVYGFYIADVDRSDDYKEIVVQVPVGDDSFLEQVLFHLDGRHLRRIGVIGQDAYFRGNGTVTAKHWQDFWWRQDTYLLRHNHTLVRMPRRFYKLDKRCIVQKPLPLYARFINQRRITVLPSGHPVRIIQYDVRGWYLVKSAGGSLGWIRQRHIEPHLGVKFMP